MVMIYVMDPCCGWCYGNRNNIVQIYEKYKDRVDFKVLPAGMWSCANASQNSLEKEDFIKKHDMVMTRRTGARLGAAYEKKIRGNPSHVFDSEPPSRAIVAVNQLKPEAAFLFAEDVLSLQFVEGKDYNDAKVYGELLSKYGIDSNGFYNMYKSNQLLQDTQTAFEDVRIMGVTGYPTLLMEREGRYEVVANGYLPFDALYQRVEAASKIGD